MGETIPLEREIVCVVIETETKIPNTQQSWEVGLCALLVENQLPRGFRNHGKDNPLQSPNPFLVGRGWWEADSGMSFFIFFKMVKKDCQLSKG